MCTFMLSYWVILYVLTCAIAVKISLCCTLCITLIFFYCTFFIFLLLCSFSDELVISGKKEANYKFLGYVFSNRISNLYFLHYRIKQKFGHLVSVYSLSCHFMTFFHSKTDWEIFTQLQLMITEDFRLPNRCKSIIKSVINS